jgi:3-oxoacyl-[acyl-carrier-protein] synthase II
VGGASAGDAITLFDASAFPTKIACEVKGFEPDRYFDRKEARRYDRCTHFAAAAARQALADAGLGPGSFDPETTGVILGSGIGGIRTFEDAVTTLNTRGPTKVSPFSLVGTIANTSAGCIAIQHGLKGPSYATTSACASGSHAIGDAVRFIRAGEADVFLAGGTEAAISPMSIGAFSAIMALTRRSDDPKTASRPFDKGRDGFVMGEGAGVLVVEELEHARRRGARIYAEIVGYGASTDAFHMTQPAPEGAGAQLAMRRCLRDAGLSPGDVQYINAHGTSTQYNDKNETEAIKGVFGERAYDLNVSSTKSGLGHSIGASGGIEAAICCKVLETCVIPPTINYETPDPDCDLNYTPNEAARRDVDVALSNSFGFGGHNATLAFRRSHD